MSPSPDVEPAPPTRPLRIREAVRAVVLDPQDRVLLVRFEFPNASRWALPGGGLELGEQHVEALQRELAEELGLVDATIGPAVWDRLHIVAFVDDSFDGQHEMIHLVRCAAFDPQPQFSWERLNAEYVFELRWWTIAEIVAATEDPGFTAAFVPADLAHHLAALLRHGPGEHPIDIGV